MPRVQSFAPIARPGARVLILGSMPGIASLKAEQYYAHPRNSFWKIMEALVGASHDLSYADRLLRLQDAGIALWDVLRSAEREGSLDSAITEAQPNDVLGLLERLHSIHCVATNGSFASAQFRRFHWAQLSARHASLRWATLPSSSPANARLSQTQKIAIWRAALEPELCDVTSVE